MAGLPDNTIRQVQAEKLRLDGLMIHGAAVNQQMALLPASYDPARKIRVAPLARYHREVWYLHNVALQPGDALGAGELRLAYEAGRREADKGDRQKGSPVAAAIRAARWAGWEFTGAHTLVLEDGHPFSMGEGTPACLGGQGLGHLYRCLEFP